LSAGAHVDGPPLRDLQDLIWAGDIPAIGRRSFPDRLALICPECDARTSYAQLDRQSDAFVALVRERGLRAGDRVAYLGRNSDQFAPVLFGAIRAGVVLVPLNWRLAAPELAYQIADADARLLILDSEFEPLARESLATCEHEIPTLFTEARGAVTSSPCLRALLAREAPAVPCSHEAAQPILQLYTSGTTGKPKGVLVSHRAFSLARHMELIDPGLTHLQAGAVLLSPMPNSHIGGISWMAMGLVRQGTVVLTADPSAPNLLRLMREFKVEHTFIVATVIRALVDELRQQGIPGPQLRGMFYGAMPMSELLLREALQTFGCAFVQFFGMTEITGSATLLPPPQHDLAHSGYLKSVGRPYPGTELEIRGPDRRVLQRGEAGEIWIRSPTLMLGYSRLPQKTREVVAGGWYASGDGGYLDEDGWLFLTDRIKDMIVSGGENVYPHEVEEALRAHTSVLDAAVVGLPDDRWGECVAALVQLRPGKGATEEELRSFARSRIAAFKCPRRIFFADMLPRTAAGKVQRVEVRRTLRERAGAPKG